MTVSPKRAKQRAKRIAADGGSHQSALDGIARAEGHRHWSDMKAAASPPDVALEAPRGAVRCPAPHPLDPRFLADAAGRDASIDLTAALLSRSVASAFLARVVATDWASRCAGAAPVLISDADTFKEAVASLRHLPEASEDFIHRVLRAAAVLGVAVPMDDAFDEVSLSPAVDYVVVRAAVLGADPIGTILDPQASVAVGVHLVAMPDGYLRDLFGRLLPGRGLSAWQAHVAATVLPAVPYDGTADLRWSILMSAGGVDFRDAVARMAALPISGARLAALLGGLVETRLTGVGHPFDGLAPPEGEGVVAAWLRDARAKVEQVRVPFSYNPVAEGTLSNHRPFTQAATVLVSMDDASPDVRAAAAALVVDVLVMLRSAGSRSYEVGAWDTETVTLGDVHRVLAVDGGIPQLMLFAAIHSARDVPGMRAAVDLPEAVETARRVTAPFVHPFLASVTR